METTGQVSPQQLSALQAEITALMTQQAAISQRIEDLRFTIYDLRLEGPVTEDRGQISEERGRFAGDEGAISGEGVKIGGSSQTLNTVQQPSSRRRMLKKLSLAAGLAIAGAGLAANAQQAQAATGGPLLIGSTANQTTAAADTTGLSIPGTTPNSIVFQVMNNATPPPLSNEKIAVLGVTYGTNGSNFGIGVFGLTDGGGNGVQGKSTSGNGVYGFASSGVGVTGQSQTGNGIYGSSTDGSGINGQSSTGSGVYGFSNTKYGVQGVSTSNHGVVGQAGSSTKAGVRGENTSGVGVSGASEFRAVEGISGSGTAIYGDSNLSQGVYGKSNQNYGGFFVSTGNAALRMFPRNESGPLTTGAHFKGEMIVDNDGNFWGCTTDGTPGAWRKLVSTSTAGGLNVFPSPGRFLDSRLGADRFVMAGNTVPSPVPGFYSSLPNTSQTISYKITGLPSKNGGPTIPTGATAILGNITVVSGANANGGYILTWPKGGPTPPTSTINYNSYQVIANSFVCGLSTDGYLNFAAFATTDVIIDVVGYYS